MSSRISQTSEVRVLPRACSYKTLVDSFRRERRSDRPLLICIDGAGASGKSTIANRLAAASEDIQVVHLDDFYRPSSDRYVGSLSKRPIGADFDLDRLRAEVLGPLRSGSASSYHLYDWEADQVSVQTVPVIKPIVIVEGVYSLTIGLSGFFDRSLWVDCPRDVRLARGLARDGEAARSRWVDDWMLGEDQYMLRESPRDRANLVCDGNRDSSRDVVILQEQLLREP
jgi:uridine kinase